MAELVQDDEKNPNKVHYDSRSCISHVGVTQKDVDTTNQHQILPSGMTDIKEMLDYAAVSGFVSGHEILIMGLTDDGKPFRPSDWCERLCGVMSQFKPPGRHAAQQHLAYSPYCLPKTMNNIKCVVIDLRLRDLEPKALNFVLNFAKDNGLKVLDVGKYLGNSDVC